MRALPLLAALAAVGFADPALAQSVALKGPDGQSAMPSAADPQVLMTVTQHSKTATFEGAPLGDVLAKAGRR